MNINSLNSSNSSHSDSSNLKLVKDIINECILNADIFENVFFDWNIIQLLVLKKWKWAWIFEIYDEEIWTYRWWPYTLNVFQKADKLKYLLYDVYITSLRASSLLNKKVRAIQPVVILPNNTSKEIYSSKVYKEFTEKKGTNIKFIWSDELNKESIINKLYSDSQDFDDNLYSEIINFANQWLHKPSFKFRKLSSDQTKLIDSKPWSQRVKWTAWTWKTTVLCSRWMNCLAKRKWKVLFLTYNVTLRNHIKKKINDLNMEFNRANIHITNYHQFISWQMLHFSMNASILSDYNNKLLFEDKKEYIEKYDWIFIDEIQDFKEERVLLIKNYYLKEDWDFVVFGDENQNVFNRDIEDSNDKFPKIWMKWPWNVLKEPYRSIDKINLIAHQFKKEFLDQYDREELEISESNKLINSSDYKNYLTYEYQDIAVNNLDYWVLLWKLLTEIEKQRFEKWEVTILSSKASVLRELDYIIRNNYHEETDVTFIQKEYRNELNLIDQNRKKNAINSKLEKAMKIWFWIKFDSIKLSTIHSFKWRESDTIIYIIDNQDRNNELVYSAITRCKNNLMIVNLWNNYYHQFFDSLITQWSLSPLGLIHIPQKKPIHEIVESISYQDIKKQEYEELKIQIQHYYNSWGWKVKILLLWKYVFEKDLMFTTIKNLLWIKHETDYEIEFYDADDIKKNDIIDKIKKPTKTNILIIWLLFNHKWRNTENLLTDLALNKSDLIPFYWWIEKKGLTKELFLKYFSEWLTNYIKSHDE